MKLLSALSFLLFGAVASAQAGVVACPDLSAAVQVNTCPSEEELRYTYRGYCSDNARLYDKERDMYLCAKYENYRDRKNIALWESADGAFNGYLSCDLKTADIKAAKPTKLSIERKNGMTRVICAYGDGMVFTQRTRAECKPAGATEAACD